MAVPAVPPNAEDTVRGSIPTRRRGIFDVGPFEIERIDPFWLTVGRRRDTGVATVIVHPKVYDLVGPQGAVRVVENESVLRRATADPMSGFVSMREYVAGDDPRMIHWPTTARTGTLMVREHVEVRRPEFTIVLDTAPTVGGPDDFEEAVDVVATLAVHAIRTGLDVVVRTTDRGHAGRPIPLVTDAQVLDLLTPVQQSEPTSLLPVSALFTRWVRPVLGGVRDRAHRTLESLRHLGTDVGGQDRRGRDRRHRRRPRRRRRSRVRPTMADVGMTDTTGPVDAGDRRSESRRACRIVVLLVGYLTVGAAACGIFDQFEWALVVAPVAPDDRGAHAGRAPRSRSGPLGAAAAIVGSVVTLAVIANSGGTVT